jgi:putative nucleotidyltransferase with HDIG domain
MGKPANPASLFSQKLDRVAFVAYLLGAVVPLVALAVVVERFALPAVADRYESRGLLAAVISIAVLSLAAFFTLRRTTRGSLSVMDRDNKRLAALLELTGSLSGVTHAGDAAERAARAALALVGARAAFVFGRSAAGAPQRLAAAGEQAEKLAQEHAEILAEVAELAAAEGHSVLRGGDGNAPALAAVPLAGEAAAGGVLVALGEPGERFDAPAAGALASLGGIAAVALRNADLRDAQRNFFTHVTDMLVAALDTSLGFHEGHGTRVAQYANRLGRALGLDDHRLERLHFASLLHDIGMLKLERHVQMNPRSCAKHAALGARMLGRIRLWHELAPIVQHHHERWDGKGYPDGLAGEAIPLESRIIAVADVFDTITSASSYKPARPLADAAREIEAHAGTQFDPEVVSAFRALVERGELEVA